MSKPNGWPMSLHDLAAGAGSMVERAVNEDVVRLAVTGLSRAGKTVFIGVGALRPLKGCRMSFPLWF